MLICLDGVLKGMKIYQLRGPLSQEDRLIGEHACIMDRACDNNFTAAMQTIIMKICLNNTGSHVWFLEKKKIHSHK